MERTSLPRLAWFTPLPPVRSGVARYSAELLPSLSTRYQIDVFVDGQPSAVQRPEARLDVRNAHDFVWMHSRRPYDLVVYQLGNAACHDYMWGYLARYPGLVVMHDGQFHHARGHLLREQRRLDDYDAEFAFNHPGLSSSVAELGASGRLGRLFFLWPMRRIVLTSARMVAVHNAWLADDIRAEHSAALVDVIEMGVPAAAPSAGARASIRTRHALPDNALVFLALGEVTPQKRMPEIIRALAVVAAHAPRAHLLLAGSPVSHFDAVQEASRHGIADRVTCAGFLRHEEIDDYLDAADVCLCLRWPTSRETSAAWLRCLAAGKATIITDLAHTTDVPAYDPRNWTLLHAPSTGVDSEGWPVRSEPATVAIDLLDEQHSLQIAMGGLAANDRLRARLGRQARALWQERFTIEGMTAAYVRTIDAACRAPMPGPATLAGLPAHFRRDGTEYASGLMRSMGLDAAELADLWSVGGGR